MDKCFETYDEQILKLKTKHLVIDSDDYAKKVLKDISYFALINGYKKEFKLPNDNYIDNTSFQDIEILFYFDENLRALFIKYILIIERRIKSYISYSFSERYPNCQHDYLNVHNYQYQIEKNRPYILKLVSFLSKAVYNTDRSYIDHYINKHDGEVPLWVLAHSLSFGNISKFYSYSQQSIQQKVCNEFSQLSNSEFGRMLVILSLFRNVCAHNERLYDYKTQRHQLQNNVILDRLGVRKQHNNYIQGNNDLFSVVVCFKYLLNESEFEKFFNELQMLITNLSFSDETVTKLKILSAMGFPENWKEIKDIVL